MHYEELFRYLNQPLIDYARQRHIDPQDVRVNFNGVTNAFTLKFKVSMWTGFILAAPVWLWEIWAFLMPGLTKKERRLAVLFIGSAIPLFAAGVFFGTMVFPSTIGLLIGATPGEAVNFPTAMEYFTFVTRFILAFGLSFLLPVFLMAFNTAGVLPARVMLKGWRIAVIAIVTFSALMTPTGDAWTMFVMSLPLLILFYGSVGLAFIMDKIRGRNEAKNRPQWMDVDDSVASPL